MDDMVVFEGGFDEDFDPEAENIAPAGGDLEPGVTFEELESILRSSVEHAVNYAEEELAGPRQAAQEFYDGQLFDGDEDLDATRSRVVSRDVHDTIKAIMPSLLRVFFAGKNAVAYDPTGPDDEQWAKQATDYVNDIVLSKDNKAFVLFYDVFHDALLKSLGTVMWYWDEDKEVVGQQYKGLTQDQLKMVTTPSQGTEIASVEVEPIEDPIMGMLYDADVTYRILRGGKIKLEAVPPEERLINKSARSIDDSKIYGRRRVMTVSEVVAMGYNYEQVVKMGGSENLDTNEEQVERYDSLTHETDAPSVDPSMRTLEYCDIYLRVDYDGDGFAELYHIACGGTNYEILEYDNGEKAMEIVDSIPFAEFCPDPIPHIATGNSISDAVMDIQKIKSNLLRGALDSLSRSIFPREEVVANSVNMDDVLNPEIGAVIRTKAPGMIREITTPFMGKEAMPLMAYMDEVKANRTGISDTTQGLNPEMLQSSTPGAVSAAVGAAQMQIEMIARILANNGMTRVFDGLLKMVKTHQDQVRTVYLRGDWVPIDPSFWNAGMDATVNTALGRGTEGERMAALELVAQKQESAMTLAGPVNPLVDWEHYRNTLAEMVTLAGYPNADRFFLPVEQGQGVQQLQEQVQQLTTQNEEYEQAMLGLQMELQSHTEAEDIAKGAKAFKDGASAIKELVDAAQTANEVQVGPDPAGDELKATYPYVNQRT